MRVPLCNLSGVKAVALKMLGTPMPEMQVTRLIPTVLGLGFFVADPGRSSMLVAWALQGRTCCPSG